MLLTVRIEVVPLLVAPNSGATLFLSVVGVSKPILCASLLLVENHHKDKVEIVTPKKLFFSEIELK